MNDELVDFQELIIKGKSEDLNNFILDITNCAKKEDWLRNQKSEKGFNGHSESNLIIFGKKYSDNYGIILSFLLNSNRDELKLANITPVGKSEISYEEYNKILINFYNSFIKDKVDEFNLDIQITEPNKKLTDFISEKSFEFLEDFSKMANKTTGSTHTLDKQRWLKFIINVYINKEVLNPELLKRWLIENEGWSLDVAIDLIIEFEFAIEVLDAFNHKIVDSI